MFQGGASFLQPPYNAHTEEMGDSRNSRDLNSKVLAENWTLRFKIAEKEAEITSLNATAKVLFMCN